MLRWRTLLSLAGGGGCLLLLLLLPSESPEISWMEIEIGGANFTGADACFPLAPIVADPPERLAQQGVVYWAPDSPGSLGPDQLRASHARSHNKLTLAITSRVDDHTGTRTPPPEHRWGQWAFQTAVHEMVRLRGKIPPAPKPPLHEQRPRVFCYAVGVGNDLETEMFDLWAAAVTQVCTRWRVYADTDAIPNVTKVFTAAGDWERTWVQHMWVPVEAAWRDALTPSSPNERPYDWVVKIDLDTYLRPSTFWRVFDGHDSSRPLVITAGDSTCQYQQRDVAQSDGYFVAVSREAGRRIFAPRADWAARESELQTDASKLTQRVGYGCPALLSGHVELAQQGQQPSASDHPIVEADTRVCQWLHDIRLVTPLDRDGFSLLMVYPTFFLGAEMTQGDDVGEATANLPWLWSGAAGCLRLPAVLLGALDDWHHVYGASPWGRWCFSPNVALLHPLKPDRVENLRALIAAGLE